MEDMKDARKQGKEVLVTGGTDGRQRGLEVPKCMWPISAKCRRSVSHVTAAPQ